MTLSVSKRIRLAWIVAILVDALQIGLLPLSGGVSMWLDKPLDVLAMVLLWRLLGWHWALVPSFFFEFLPIAELAPTWTLATLIIVRQRKEEMQGVPVDAIPGELHEK
jgi:hypothetical protein